MFLCRLSIVLSLFAAGCSSSQPPASLELVALRGGKPPMRMYLTRLTLHNTFDHPVWFVFPYWADQPPVATGGRLSRPNDPDHILEGAGYDGKKLGGVGRVVIVKDVGQFNAIHIPAHSEIRFDTLDIEAMTAVEALGVFEADSLLVNGRTPLEKWFPYDTLSDANAHITGDRGNNDWDNLDWDYTTHETRKDLTKEKPKFIEAKILGKWKLPIGGAAAANQKGPWH